MIGGDHVDGSVCQSFQQRALILCPVNRRIHLESAVVINQRRIQKQIVRRRLTTHIDAAALGIPDQFNGFFRGDVADMEGAAGLLCETQISFDLTPFPLPGILIAHILTVPGDQFPKRFAALHGLPHEPIIRNAHPVVRERNDMRGQTFQIGKLPAFFTDRDGTVGENRNGYFGNPIQLRLKMVDAVRDRIQIRHGADGSVTG